MRAAVPGPIVRSQPGLGDRLTSSLDTTRLRRVPLAAESAASARATARSIVRSVPRHRNTDADGQSDCCVTERDRGVSDGLRSRSAARNAVDAGMAGQDDSENLAA